MGFKLPDSYLKKKQEEYDMKYILINEEKEVHVSELEDKSVTPGIWRQMRMNSYARDDLYPKLNNEALLEVTKLYLSNCSRPQFPCSTYDEAMIHKIVPELIKRLEEVNDD
ncbi:hypothetical protein [Siminovitchia fordii]|uniref:Phage protein n=1 Tax=Siminovitchia fordii TaxID=254759 RepID=A0ABQ4KAD4_9BACI|nr:hypothetical protein [Siminovitchia fordii]GIN22571.1 hypothetical protein J1TS3_37050 [Siminovitchia fordii]